MVSSELDLNEALSTEPMSRENILSLKNQIYTSKANYEELENKIKELKSTISTEKGTPETKKNTLILGICLWISGNQAEAFEVLATVPSSKFTCYFLGKCHQEREEYEKALDYFERAKQANEEEFEIHVRHDHIMANVIDQILDKLKVFPVFLGDDSVMQLKTDPVYILLEK
mgnify:CR=1 FL=1